MNAKRNDQYEWDALTIRALRQYMGLSQQQMSEKLGVRQQTISEWETGMYKPRGGMRTLLTLVAERVQFDYDQIAETPPTPDHWTQEPVSKLDLSPRAIKALQAAGMQRVGQVLALWHEKPSKFLDIPDFGQRSLDVLRQELQKHGLIY